MVAASYNVVYHTPNDKVNDDYTLNPPKIKEPFNFSRKLVVHFRRNCSRFREQRYAISSSVCPTGVMHGLLHVEVVPDFVNNSIFFMWFR